MFKDDAVILVTGGSRGIGAATSQALAQLGCRVCVNYRQDRQSADALVATIEHAGGRAIAVRADVSNERQIMDMFATVDHEFGRLDGLVNNAGILERQMRLEDITADRLMRILTANVMGSFICAREAVRRMSTKFGGNGGAIVNVSSMAARLGAPNEYVDYAASKAAIDAMTIGLSKEVADEGIRVNAVRPGLIRTEIHASGGEPGRVERLQSGVPMLRGGEAHEVAQAIVWLLSEKSSYTTGGFIDVSGGR